MLLSSRFLSVLFMFDLDCEKFKHLTRSNENESRILLSIQSGFLVTLPPKTKHVLYDKVPGCSTS